MVVYSGIDTTVLIGAESTYGTPVAATKDLGLIQNVTSNPDQAIREIFTVGSTNCQKVVAGKVNPKGSLEMLFQHGRIYSYLLGDPAHSTTSSDTEHDWDASIDVTPKSVTMEVGKDGTSDITHTYSGVVIPSITTGLALDGELSIKADWMGQDVIASATTSAAVISTLEVLSDFQGDFKIGAATSEASVGQVQSWELTLNRTNTSVYEIGGRVPELQKLHELHATGRFSLAFEDDVEYQRFLGGTSFTDTASPTAFSAIFEADNGIALGSGQRKLSCNIRDAQYAAVSEPIPIDNIIIQDFEMTGIFYSLKTVDNIAEASW